ncbi:threonine ammonia-lyase [Tuwongella immobilis]|uniref:Tryptophan synthase beta chain-like PALP domain-containing protein n=1 Tax=Tuwongella immobilis TaxID=692036 RepID=A0A6C2YS39_9BACT|nr:threonine/serine dehydratase [Tuwongella immobilis]VIP04286.1 threonine dehydratase : Pyridoxal-5'-phosphate-dependent protein beta subunit OS=Thermobaculum terrenum (strain ATCC BAA-798 / YNP1) GN=Tter_0227 PE=4 SV=1: PALP [Tuwongella immobilis]VTS05935.1 threonine dehydratase : Pyridoxal-5'-phosphate-dependent protein beta subunit OS=Thermobaculum terrenum (strain ATCC BAA-798 / YNP1) GN=Tter_0227 PE=4 SV=1: PALP [Tuwongella immobilis]
MLTIDAILQAQNRLAGKLHRTPLVRSAAISAILGADVYLKLECLQKTGSFKPRGALNKMLTLTESERSAGVVAVSGGNHAQGVAYAGRQLGVATTIVMPETTPRNYLDATRGYGATVVLTPDIRAAFAQAEQMRQQGMVMIHPFDDPLVAAGQGTVALEILADLPEVDRCYVSIGGGGLIAGMGLAFRSIRPQTRVIGVETIGADAMAQALAAGQLVELPAITSIARTLGAPKVSEMTLQAVRDWVESVQVVSDRETVQALFTILERTKQLVEPGAACVLAAAMQQRASFRPNEKIVLLLCGGNLSVSDLVQFAHRFEMLPA